MNLDLSALYKLKMTADILWEFIQGVMGKLL